MVGLLSYYVYPGQEAIVSKAYGKTKDMFRVFEELTGIDYPYNKYDQTIVADFNFGGMENITATTMSDTDIMFARFGIGEGLVEDLVSHELAHSWFGNLVTCRNWAELWLNEGFATFMEAAYREKIYGRQDYIRKIRLDSAEYFGHASNLSVNQHGLFNTLASARNDDTMFDSITYQKGSAVIHTLREELGEKAFWKGVKIYLSRHKFANVETPDLVKAMEEASERKLDWFFKQWIYSEGYPKLKVDQTYDKTRKKLILKISQTQRADADTPAVFKLPMDVEIKTDGGNVTRRIEIDRRIQELSIDVPQRPFRVTFDKDFRIPLKTVSFSKLKSVN